ncbi:MAG: FluC/FEX family fluoride channel [Egibacteraceae bacterium]
MRSGSTGERGPRGFYRGVTRSSRAARGAGLCYLVAFGSRCRRCVPADDVRDQRLGLVSARVALTMFVEQWPHIRYWQSFFCAGCSVRTRRFDPLRRGRVLPGAPQGGCYLESVFARLGGVLLGASLARLRSVACRELVGLVDPDLARDSPRGHACGLGRSGIPVRARLRDLCPGAWDVPVGTSVVNVTGSLALGAVTGLALHHGLPAVPRTFVCAGFLGAARRSRRSRTRCCG